MTLVSQLIPDFTASAVLKDGKIIDNFNIKKYLKNKYGVIFFWPMDFTFVCPSEIIAFNKRYKEFKKRNVKIVGVSIDSVFVHHAWRKTSISNGGIENVEYPMISDIDRKIMKKYDVIHQKEKVALRAVFIIDKNGIVRSEIINDLPFGRNIEEIIRIIDAIQFYEKHKQVCPAQWNLGKSGIVPNSKGISEYLSKNLKDL
ncbi:peroxiredoxin [bacterium endosymbiont of Pedicinus badii]|uniref:peroxiredoxin n=1 Tax=bacterium endosymbiont of Pedicinus badii TaxID=1719126 RepID=UPI0009BB3BAD|nr:redoxin domain-containing protein [bacterium endosymbiont of Pedicinus badii]OQM34280.1 peroxiredoxin [bacterium endosymbiont of Pedicinus badii]